MNQHKCINLSGGGEGNPYLAFNNEGNAINESRQIKIISKFFQDFINKDNTNPMIDIPPM